MTQKIGHANLADARIPSSEVTPLPKNKSRLDSFVGSSENSSGPITSLLKENIFADLIADRLRSPERAALRITCKTLLTQLTAHPSYAYDQFCYRVSHLQKQEEFCALFSDPCNTSFLRNLCKLCIDTISVSLDLLKNLAQNCPNLQELTFYVENTNNLSKINLLKNNKQLRQLSIQKQDYLSGFIYNQPVIPGPYDQVRISHQPVINAIAELTQLQIIKLPQMGLVPYSFKSWCGLTQLTEVTIDADYFLFKNDLLNDFHSFLLAVKGNLTVLDIAIMLTKGRKLELLLNTNYPKLKKIQSDQVDFSVFDAKKLPKIEHICCRIELLNIAERKELSLWLGKLSQSNQIKTLEINSGWDTHLIFNFTRQISFHDTETIKIVGGRVNRQTFSDFKCALQLKTLTLENVRGTLIFPKKLNFDKLESFYFQAGYSTNTIRGEYHFDFLQRCPNLKHLHLDLSGIQDSISTVKLNLADLVLPNLESLTLNGKYFSNKDLNLIQHALKLKTLQCYNTSCNSLSNFEFKNLTEITLIGNEFAAYRLEALASCQQLKIIHLENIHVENKSPLFLCMFNPHHCKKLKIRSCHQDLKYVFLNSIPYHWDALKEIELDGDHYVKFREYNRDALFKSFKKILSEKEFFNSVSSRDFQAHIS